MEHVVNTSVGDYTLSFLWLFELKNPRLDKLLNTESKLSKALLRSEEKLSIAKEKFENLQTKKGVELVIEAGLLPMS